MGTYIARRLIQGIVVLLAVSMICFFIFRYMGDPVVTMAGRYATHQEREEVRKMLGLDKPVLEQYGLFLWNALHGNFGKSYVTRVPALGLILERFPATFELAFSAVLIAFCVGVGLGVLVSIKPYALRNAMIPVVTISGLQFGEIIAFSIVTETIFQWPGMGNLLLTSIYETDRPVIVTYIMLAAVIIITMNTIVDILYAIINPKIRYD
jgi:ABC-type dipeptide/oligopeptide/nickel transport system permease component